MPRYVAVAARPRLWDGDGPMMERPSVTVHEEPREPRATGLLDACGVPLYRRDDREPIGFRLSPRTRA